MLGMYYHTFDCKVSSRRLSWMERAGVGDNLKAIKFLADYGHFLCDDMKPEQRKPLGLKMALTDDGGWNYEAAAIAKILGLDDICLGAIGC